MSKLDKIFDVVDKVDNAVDKAEKMQRTTDNVEKQTKKISSAKSDKLRWTLLIIILVIAVLYIFFG